MAGQGTRFIQDRRSVNGTGEGSIAASAIHCLPASMPMQSAPGGWSVDL